MTNKNNIKKEYMEVAIETIIPYENNCKIHTDKDINEVVKSIKKNSDLAPMIIDEDNIIIIGHGRLEAFKKLKYKKILLLKVT
jgi:ParB-like chromosome segregation protein Spo0J